MGKMEERIRSLELEGEKKRREKRKQNIIIRGVEKDGWEGLKEKVEGIVKETGAVAKIEGIRRIGRRSGEGREMLWVRFVSVEEKVEIIRGNKNLKGRKVWISDDLTEKERRIEWLIKTEAERRSRKGMRVKVGYMKLWIDGKLWVWDEIKDESVGDERGRERDKKEERVGERFFVWKDRKGGEKKKEEKRVKSWWGRREK